ncbi:Adenosine 3'-phospho 5'-phosphosulfate transporter 2 (PAPS transporter 2) (Solute carrier family 35 member B3) [Durusdinium trenchii]|uniref:Adenosine 3'-phospho 5'-phosphosulfate transporter 2 (PAPS transporter 2) (Solute carrier family 35 member B3) n=1 Tax=Durusdinium trenchii TaxID=1381693 RepID=A0ABP0SDR1_9DINO
MSGILGISPRLFRLSAIVVLLHGIAAVCTEYVFQVEGFAFGLFYTFLQCFTFAVLALLKSVVSGGLRLNSWAIRGPVLAGLSMTVSHGAGILSYLEVNYTTAMIFKSAKVPSVVLGGRWINKNQTMSHEMFWAICMMIGLLLFGLGDGLESARFTGFGLVLIAINLAGSTLTANLQQKVLQSPVPCSVQSMMLVQYAAASAVLLLYIASTTELSSAIIWYLDNSSAFFYTMLDNLLTYIGLEAVMRITKDFDATRANVVCSGRKAITFLFSYWFFPKPFGPFHALGLLLTLVGGWNLQRVKWNAESVEALHSLCDGEADAAAVSATITAAGKGSRWEIALALYQSHELTLRLAGAALGACAAGRQWQVALSLLQEMPQRTVQPDAACFGIVAGSCERVGHHSFSSKLLADMCNVPEATTLAIGFTFAMSEANRANYWERSLHLFSRACRLQLSLDTTAFSAALAACQTGSAWHQSLAILHMLQDQVWSSSPGSLVVAYSAAIGACVHRGQWALALRLLGRCQQETAQFKEAQQPLLVAVHTALSAVAETLHWEKALELLPEMAEAEGAARLAVQRATNAAALACGRSAAWQKALMPRLVLRTEPTQLLQKALAMLLPQQPASAAVCKVCHSGCKLLQWNGPMHLPPGPAQSWWQTQRLWWWFWKAVALCAALVGSLLRSCHWCFEDFGALAELGI